MAVTWPWCSMEKSLFTTPPSETAKLVRQVRHVVVGMPRPAKKMRVRTQSVFNQPKHGGHLLAIVWRAQANRQLCQTVPIQPLVGHLHVALAGLAKLVRRG